MKLICKFLLRNMHIRLQICDFPAISTNKSESQANQLQPVKIFFSWGTTADYFFRTHFKTMFFLCVLVMVKFLLVLSQVEDLESLTGSSRMFCLYIKTDFSTRRQYVWSYIYSIARKCFTNTKCLKNYIFYKTNYYL